VLPPLDPSHRRGGGNDRGNRGDDDRDGNRWPFGADQEEMLDDAANRSAERLLSSRGPLIALRGRIGCRRHDQTKALSKAIHEAARPEGHLKGADIDRAIVVRSDEGGSLAIHVVPITPVGNWGEAAPAGAAAALFVAEEHLTAARPLNAFAARYGLTRMESRVLAEIITGDGLPRVAERLRIGSTTARSHLQQVFLKTETARRAELVRLFFEATAPIAART
jgi:DNA-binding CsgD family transcriptional regulator